MVKTFATSRSAPHAEYRRRARRIRALHVRDTARRMRALRDLADLHDATREGEAPPRPLVCATHLADLVRESMEGSILRYARRARLLREAARRGIGRFEANLIIAAVQHQAGVSREREGATPRRSWVSIVFGFGATQCAIGMGIWLVLG